MRKFPVALLAGFVMALACLLVFPSIDTSAQESPTGPLVTGLVMDSQGVVVEGAQVELIALPSDQVLAQAATQPDGRYSLVITGKAPDSLELLVTREHFQDATLPLDTATVQRLQNGETIEMPQVTLARRITLAFWVATAIFIGMLVLIAMGGLHNTLAALVGASTVFAVSYLGSSLLPDLFIFKFQSAIQYVDWNVIFLIMGMMIVIAVVERTGLFQWLAFNAYRLSGGRIWLLMPILMLVTGVVSAMLDNVTTMLLITPMTIQIALAIGLNPLALLMPEVLASNIAGISTLIGTPTNILIGSFAKISFNSFLINQTPGVLLAILGLVLYCEWTYRKEIRHHNTDEVGSELLQKLKERARITQPGSLKKVGIVGAGMLLLFVFGEQFNLMPSVTALMGATVLLVWIRPDIEEMIEAVDWTTLVFFIGLFIVVGAVKEVGLISLIAQGIGSLVGTSILLAMLAVIWSSALLSTVIANIPFTAAMLPVIAYLSATVPGAHSKLLFFCLSVGSAMGGNGSLIGASANMVTAGIAERAGYPISYFLFLKRGMPALVITVALATIWLVIRFLVLGGQG